MAIKIQQHEYDDRLEFIVNLDNTKFIKEINDQGVEVTIPDPDFQRVFAYQKSDVIIDMVASTSAEGVVTNSSKPRLNSSGEQLYGHADENGDFGSGGETLKDMYERYKLSAIALAKSELSKIEPPPPIVTDIEI